MIDLANISFRLDIQNYALAVAFFLNIILAVVIFVNSRKHKEYLSFSLLAFSVSLWALGMFMYRGVFTTEAAILWTKFYYVFAGIIPASFLYFSLNFPLKHPSLGRITKWLLTGFGFVSILSPFFGDFIVSDVVVQRIGENKIFFGMGLLTWGFYLVTYFLLAFYFLLNRYFSKTIDRVVRIQYNFILIGSGSAVLVGVFTNHVLPLFFQDPTYAWIGPTASLIMTFFILAAIFKHNLFNIKLIITELMMFLVWVVLLVNLLISRGAETFLPNLSVLIILIIAGILVIRGVVNDVKRETREKEKEIQHRKEVEKLNRQQESLMKIMNHQIKGYLGKNRSIFAELLTNDYGNLPEMAMPLLKEGLEQSAQGVEYVQGILRGASAASGILPYDMKPMDAKKVAETVVAQEKPTAEEKGLSFESTIVDGDYSVVGDAVQLGEVFKNLITNAVKYNTPGGSIKVDLRREDRKIIFSVKDTGVGVSDEDKPKLFTVGGMGKNSIKINVEAAGFGLAFVKGVAEAHKGTAGYKPNDSGKGSTFYIELPVNSSIQNK